MAYDLTARLKLNDELSKPMKKATKQVGKTSNATDKLTKSMKVMDKAALVTGAGVAAAFATAGTAVVNAGLDAQEAQKNIVSSTGATGDALDGLMQSYREVGSQVPQDLSKVSQAIGDMNTMTDSTGDNLEGMTKRVLDASRMMKEDGVSNVNAFGRALNQWQIPAEQGEETVAKLFQVAQNTGLGFGELASHMTEYGSVLNNAGFSADEAASLFGNLEQSGLSVSRLMPGLNQAFRNWAKEGKNAQDELANTIERMQEASNSTKALSIASEEFGAEGAQRLMTAVETGTLSLEDLGSGLDDAVANMNNANDASKTFGQRWSEAMNAVNSALQPIGKLVLDITQDYLQGLQDKAGELAAYIKSNMPEIKSAIVDFADRAEEVIGNVIDKATDFYNTIKDNWPAIKTTAITLGGAFVALRGAMLTLTIVQTITGLWRAYRAVALMVTTSQIALNLAMYANPIGIVIGLIVGLIAAGVWLARNWDTVTEKAGELWSSISSFFGKIGDKTSTIWGNVEDWISDAMDSAGTAVSNFFDPLFGFIEDVKGAWSSFTDMLGNFSMPDLGGLASGAMNFVTGGGADGSHYAGLDRVPFDGYRAILHRNEMVVPAGPAEAIRKGEIGGRYSGLDDVPYQNPAGGGHSMDDGGTTRNAGMSSANNSGGGGGTGEGFSINIEEMNVRNEEDIDKFAKKLSRELHKAQAHGAGARPLW